MAPFLCSSERTATSALLLLTATPPKFCFNSEDESLVRLERARARVLNAEGWLAYCSTAFGKVAASGFCVIVPDFFYGDPFVYDDNRPLAVWLEDHGTGFEDAKSVIDALKGKGFSAIGAAGFCWGAKVVTELAKFEFIQAAVLLHPSLIALDDIEGVKAPMAVLGAEIDNYSPPELLKQFEEILNAKPEKQGAK